MIRPEYRANRRQSGHSRAPRTKVPGYFCDRAYTPSMSTVRVRVNLPVLEWAAGDIVEVERTRLVAGLIASGTVSELPADDETPADPAPALEFPATLEVPQQHAGTAVRGELSVDVVVVPPRTGKGSGAEEWRTFLDGQGVDTSGISTKADLVAAWDAEAARREGAS